MLHPPERTEMTSIRSDGRAVTALQVRAAHASRSPIEPAEITNAQRGADPMESHDPASNPTAAPELRRRFRGALDSPLRRALLAGALACGLATGGALSVAVGSERGGEPAASDAAVTALDEAFLEERPTAGQAARRARSLGRPVEVLGLRTETRSIFVDPSGSRSAKLYSAPVRIREGGRWRGLDVDLEDADGKLRPKAAATELAFSDGGDRSLARIEGEQGALGLNWKGERLPRPELGGAQATYRDVEPGVDLALSARAQGFEERVVVRPAPRGALVLRFGLELRGLRARLTADERLELRDERGRRVAVADPAQMWGEKVGRHSQEPLRQARVATRLVDHGGRQVLELRPDQAFLRSAEGPVTIATLANLTTNADTYVSSDSPSANYGKSTELRSGSYNGRNLHRSLIRFPRRAGDGSNGLDGIPRGARVTSASLGLYNHWSWSCQPRTTVVHRVADSWGVTSATWARQPAVGARYGSSHSAKGYSSACPAGWVGFPITSLAQKWVDNEVPNHGVRIQPQDEARRDTFSWRKFRSGNYASGSRTPFLAIDYEQPGS